MPHRANTTTWLEQPLKTFYVELKLAASKILIIDPRFSFLFWS